MREQLILAKMIFQFINLNPEFLIQKNVTRVGVPPTPRLCVSQTTAEVVRLCGTASLEWRWTAVREDYAVILTNHGNCRMLRDYYAKTNAD